MPMPEDRSMLDFAISRASSLLVSLVMFAALISRL
jgi:hypothetical protein